MEEVFYTKFKNLHITNNLNNIKIEQLESNDGVMVLSNGTEVTSVHLKFNNIVNNNIVTFNKLNTNSDYYKSFSSSNISYDYDGTEKVHFYYHNQKYLNIFHVPHFNVDVDQQFISAIYKLHKNNTKGKYISGKFIDNKKLVEDNKIGIRKQTSIYSFLIFPTDDKTMKVLVNFDLERKSDYLIYFKPLSLNTKTPFFSTELYRVDAINMMQILDLEQTKHVKWFNDLLFATDYDTEKYIVDPEREEHLNYINNFLNTNFNKTSHIKPVFENKELDLKAYIEKSRVIISWKDKPRYYNDGRYDSFQNQNIFLQGVVMKIEVDNEIKENLEFQKWYKIAYDIANFKIYKRGIDPITGDYYINGEINNKYIMYKDVESIVVNESSSKSIYVNNDGYYIKSSDGKEIKDVLDRMVVSENLKNAN